MTRATSVAGAMAWLLSIVIPAVAAAQTERTVGYLPVAGSTRGAQGSDFKTSLRILNPNHDPIAGRIVFHPAGRSVDPADPSIDYSLGPQQSQSFDDVAAAIGVEGIGSLEVTIESPADPTLRPPVFVARIFNDAGAAGTSGFTAPLFVPATARPSPPGAMVLLGPTLTDRFRYNIGVLNVGPAVDLTVEVLDPSGAVVHTVPRSYPERYFQQTTAADFAGIPLQGGQSIRVSPPNARVIVYGATVDNTTNDPSAQYASLALEASRP